MPRQNALLWIDLEMTGLDPEKDRIIEMAAIISERVGMLWARPSFSATSPPAAYYFNPSDDQWSFTKVSEDTEFPDWLPYIEP